MSNKSDKAKPYDPDKLAVLQGLEPPRKRGVTIVGELPHAKKKIDVCAELLRVDGDLWYIRLVGKSGQEMLIYRDPHP